MALPASLTQCVDPISGEDQGNSGGIRSSLGGKRVEHEARQLGNQQQRLIIEAPATIHIFARQCAEHKFVFRGPDNATIVP